MMAAVVVTGVMMAPSPASPPCGWAAARRPFILLILLLLLLLLVLVLAVVIVMVLRVLVLELVIV